MLKILEARLDLKKERLTEVMTNIKNNDFKEYSNDFIEDYISGAAIHIKKLKEEINWFAPFYMAISSMEIDLTREEIILEIAKSVNHYQSMNLIVFKSDIIRALIEEQ